VGGEVFLTRDYKYERDLKEELREAREAAVKLRLGELITHVHLLMQNPRKKVYVSREEVVDMFEKVIIQNRKEL
jgi:hypothetical protein